MGTIIDISKRDMLIAHLKYATDNEIDFISDLLNLERYPNKFDLFKLAGKDREYYSKVDSATPIDYYRKIAELYPGFTNGNMCYDYNEPNTHGAMLNINDLVVQRILNLKK